MRKISVCLMAVALAVLVAGAAQASTIQVGFNPSAPTVAAGGLFSVDVVADIPTDASIVGFGFNLVFDPDQVKLQDVAGGPLWDVLWDPDLFPAEYIPAFLAAGPNSPEFVTGNDVLLATLYFSCLGLGTSNLSINVDPEDFTQGFIGPSTAGLLDGQYRDWAVTPAEITQTEAVIPEPATLLLLASGLGGLAAARKRRRR